MARSFSAGSSQKLTNTSFTGFDGQNKLTMVGWGYRADSEFMTIGAGLDVNTAFNIIHYTDNVVYFEPFNLSTDYAAQQLYGNSPGWRHYAMVFDGTASGNSNRLKCYIDNVLQFPSFVGTIPALMGTVGRMDIGFNDNNGYSTSSNAEVAVYRAALTDEEISLLYAGVSALLVRPDALVGYWPLQGRATDEEDWVGGFTLTNVNGCTVSDHPVGVIYPSSHRLILPPTVLTPSLPPPRAFPRPILTL